jgi:PhnB protein
MEINPYLSFDGWCAEAFNFYASVLGGTILTLMPYGGSPMANAVSEGWQDKVMHARLKVANQIIMGSDSMPGQYEPPRGYSPSISVADAAEAERIFPALAEGGTVHMALQATFWAVRFGVLQDRFGIAWMVNCEQAH